MKMISMADQIRILFLFFPVIKKDRTGSGDVARLAGIDIRDFLNTGIPDSIYKPEKPAL